MMRVVLENALGRMAKNKSILDNQKVMMLNQSSWKANCYNQPQ
jgi:hypothetical protein